MAKSRSLNELLNILTNHEKRIRALEGKKPSTKISEIKIWYQPGSTIDKVVNLIKEGFFKTPRSISEIISELETKDYHLKAPDLTLPLRKIVRKGLLKRTKKKRDGSPSKTWLYVKA